MVRFLPWLCQLLQQLHRRHRLLHPLMQQHHSPQHHSLQHHSPQHHSPQHYSPQHHSPQHHSLQHHSPQHHSPQHHSPQHHLPQPLRSLVPSQSLTSSPSLLASYCFCC